MWSVISTRCCVMCNYKDIVKSVSRKACKQCETHRLRDSRAINAVRLGICEMAL
jgi:hypothetical protein